MCSSFERKTALKILFCNFTFFSHFEKFWSSFSPENISKTSRFPSHQHFTQLHRKSPATRCSFIDNIISCILYFPLLFPWVSSSFPSKSNLLNRPLAICFTFSHFALTNFQFYFYRSLGKISFLGFAFLKARVRWQLGFYNATFSPLLTPIPWVNFHRNLCSYLKERQFYWLKRRKILVVLLPGEIFRLKRTIFAQKLPSTLNVDS